MWRCSSSRENSRRRSSSPLPEGSKAKLSVVKGLRAGKNYALKEGVTYVGRKGPHAVDVDLTEQGRARLDRLRAAVAAVAPAARVDDNAQWLAPLASLIGALKWLAAGLVLLIYNRRVSALKKAHAAQEAFSRRLIESQ